MKDSTESFVHDNVSQTPCPACGKLMLAVTGKSGADAGLPLTGNAGTGRTSAWKPTPAARSATKSWSCSGTATSSPGVCRCGFREKAEKFRERTGAGAGMSKRAGAAVPGQAGGCRAGGSAFALALQKAMEDKEKIRYGPRS